MLWRLIIDHTVVPNFICNSYRETQVSDEIPEGFTRSSFFSSISFFLLYITLQFQVICNFRIESDTFFRGVLDLSHLLFSFVTINFAFTSSHCEVVGVIGSLAQLGVCVLLSLRKHIRYGSVTCINSFTFLDSLNIFLKCFIFATV